MRAMALGVLAFAVCAVAEEQGPFKGDMDSLKQYQCPEWFRDAKFGIWEIGRASCRERVLTDV